VSRCRRSGASSAWGRGRSSPWVGDPQSPTSTFLLRPAPPLQPWPRVSVARLTGRPPIWRAPGRACREEGAEDALAGLVGAGGARGRGVTIGHCCGGSGREGVARPGTRCPADRAPGFY
jgi:hypothetical protein